MKPTFSNSSRLTLGLGFSLLASVTSLSLAAESATPGLSTGGVAALSKSALKSGINQANVDPSVRAQDDLFANLNGSWLKSTDIPADKSSWGTFARLRDEVTPKLLAIIDGAARDTSAPAGSEARKIGDFYASYMDEARINTLGLSPLVPEMGRIAALHETKDLAGFLARNTMLGLRNPFDLTIHQDAHDSTHYVADLVQSGLGMPDRDYYLSDEAKLKTTRAAYLKYLATMLAFAGDTHATTSAEAVLALETELAKIQWSKVANRDPARIYNKVELAKLTRLAPGFDWPAYIDGVGIGGKTDFVNVSQPSYLTGFAKLLDKTPMATWQAYFRVQLLTSYADYLPQNINDETFGFYGTTLTGVTEMSPRWKRGVETVDGAMGEALGKIYVHENFPAERKARVEALVKNLLLAFRQGIDKLDWMSAATRKQAQDKLAKFSTKIGYPNKWHDYSALSVARDDLVGNVTRARVDATARELNKLGRPIDRDEWNTTPQTVNANYTPEMNEILFPAAILQPPFFDMDADDAVNYGAIGGVIGHEISHGFDDEGAQYDGDGNMRNWWTARDHRNFAAKTKMLVAQYKAFSPVPGYQVNGQLTLGENIADNSGLSIAYSAYQLTLGGQQAPVIDGLSGDQRFFMGWSQVWCSKMRDAQQIVYLKSDPHSPAKIRVNGTVANMPQFYSAFSVKAGDKMYLPPKKRVRIW